MKNRSGTTLAVGIIAMLLAAAPAAANDGDAIAWDVGRAFDLGVDAVETNLLMCPRESLLVEPGPPGKVTDSGDYSEEGYQGFQVYTPVGGLIVAVCALLDEIWWIKSMLEGCAGSFNGNITELVECVRPVIEKINDCERIAETNPPLLRECVIRGFPA